MKHGLEIIPAVVLLCLMFAAGARAQELDRITVTDPVIAAMGQELSRSKGLRLASLEDTYFVQYSLDDVESFSATATLGALVSRGGRRIRVPQVFVRVGSPEFDNTNYVYTDVFARRSGRVDQAPLGDNVIALRSYFWLATDLAYKGALEGLSRKRAAVRNVNLPEKLPDFAPAEPVTLIEPPRKVDLDEEAWADRVKRLSKIFEGYPRITDSSIRFDGLQATTYLMNTEGTVIRHPENLFYVQVRASAQAKDGMLLRNAVSIPRQRYEDIPSELDLQRRIEEVAAALTSLLDAPIGEAYVGPVLFEGNAAAQLFAQMLGSNLALLRRPVPEPNRNTPFQQSSLEGRLGSRVLPEWMNVVDDPTQTEWRGGPLIGSYKVDIEGVKPEPLRLIEDGVLRSYLLTRQPVKGFTGSNGRARLPGIFGASRATISNLFVQSAESVPDDGLKKRLIEMCESRGKPYGILVRQLDYPSSASLAEFRRLAMDANQGGSGGHLVSQPIMAYRVYPDGREELVRGLEFRRFTVRALRDILAASAETYNFHFILNNFPLSLMGAGGFVTSCSVVAPSVLIEDVELAPSDNELPKLPVVPPPALVVSN